MLDPRAEKVLKFWFRESVNEDDAIKSRMGVWFGNNQQVDDDIELRFASLVDDARSGALHDWRDLPRGRLALVLLLDQFPRNLYRGTGKAFAMDAAALELCIKSIEDSRLLELSAIEQVFLLMPLQHTESAELQQRSVREFDRLLERIEPDRRQYFKGFADYARLHCDIIQRFGRFPHRNAMLGRENTDEEKLYLLQGAPRFGQGG